jgi:HEPN domain-containing protein
MKQPDSTYPADWLGIADKDWARVDMLLPSDPELAGFCLQQAVEKYLKAFLLAKGWTLRRLHNLEALLDQAVVHEPRFDAFRPVCQRITAFYFLERYPFMTPSSITEADVREAKREVEPLIIELRALTNAIVIPETK